MLAAMAQHYPQLKGVVFDLPSVAPDAEQNINALGLSKRLQVMAGSFLDPLPPALGQCDAFYMKFILHDWPDDECVTILKNIAKVAKNGATIVTTDFILGVDGANMEMNKKMMDINMMASNPPGAGERTVDEYMALFAKAGIAATPELVKMRDLVSTVVAQL